MNQYNKYLHNKLTSSVKIEFEQMIQQTKMILKIKIT